MVLGIFVLLAILAILFNIVEFEVFQNLQVSYTGQSIQECTKKNL